MPHSSLNNAISTSIPDNRFSDFAPNTDHISGKKALKNICCYLGKTLSSFTNTTYRVIKSVYQGESSERSTQAATHKISSKISPKLLLTAQVLLTHANLIASAPVIGLRDNTDTINSTVSTTNINAAADSSIIYALSGVAILTTASIVSFIAFLGLYHVKHTLSCQPQPTNPPTVAPDNEDNSIQLTSVKNN